MASAPVLHPAPRRAHLRAAAHAADRSVLANQLLVTAATVVLLGTVLAIRPSAATSLGAFAATSVVFVLAAAAAVVPWQRLPHWVPALVPTVDIVALAVVREGSPDLGLGLFLVFPVMWLARRHRVPGAVTGIGLVTGAVVTGAVLRAGEVGITDLPAVLLLPVMLTAVAGTIIATTGRTDAQRVLLHQQAGLIESALARARRQEHLLHTVLDTVEFGVIAFDRFGTVVLLNEAYRRTLRRYADRGATLVPIVYRADRVTPFGPHERPIARAVRGEAFDAVVVWMGEPGDERSAFSVTSRRLHTSDGAYDGTVVVLRDVTAELEAVQTRDDLVASVSHELRTPLTSVLGYLDLVLDEPGVDESTRQLVATASRNAERLLRIVNDLLDATADGAPAIATERVDLGRLVDDAVDDHHTIAADQAVLVHRTGEARLDAEIDPGRVRQILDNLLSNAVKYNRSPGMVTVDVRQDGAAAVVRVTDTGHGISTADQQRLFDRYFRTEGARRSAVHGTGLGLAVSRMLARSHGGDLTASSVPGSGSTFTLRLPLVPERVAAPAPAATRAPAPAPVARRTATATPTPHPDPTPSARTRAVERSDA